MRKQDSTRAGWTGFLLACASVFATPASASTAGSYHISGDIKDITSIHGGLLVRMDGDKVPTDCANSASSWMKISETDTAMTSLILSYWLQGKTRFTLYIDNWSSGYCTIAQADPDR